MAKETKVLKLGKNKREERRAPLFQLDGKEYSVLLNPGPNVGLTFMEIQAEAGQEAATVYMLKTMVGEDAFKALAANPDITDDEYEELMAEISRLALADQETTVKN